MTRLQTIPKDYVERVYAGWLGKTIGVRHGGNVEGWSYDRLKRTFGEIKGYLQSFKKFAADDDTNGPVFFVRALEDYTYTRDITAEQMGQSVLNYVPDGHSFFWWGGYGVSTEHTAYLNLKKGIPAPRSGSVEQNGPTVAEQIGGQIFIDVWGMIAPGNPQLAAEYAGKMASVTHGGNGVYGGQFIAACIAEAFVERDMNRIIEMGLSFIPDDSEYARMAKDVIAFHRRHPDNWHDAFHHVYERWGYSKYPGACHIIPNSAVIILSLLYGGDSFSDAINICTMCGWDTDCNVGNVGAIMGIRGGLQGIDPSWREPINDFLCCSSVIGCLNATELPCISFYTAQFGYKIAGEAPSAEWKEILNGQSSRFHFELPGSTHAFRTDHDGNLKGKAKVEGTDEAAHTGKRSLKASFERPAAECGYRIYYKTYYTRHDFNDRRYDPSFSPTLYPGQVIEARVMIPGGDVLVRARAYIKDRNTNLLYYGDEKALVPGEWTAVRYAIPPMSNVCIEEAGVELKGERWDGIVYVDDVDFRGKPAYEIYFAKEQYENWGAQKVSQLTILRGLWSLENGELSASFHGEQAEAYTGDLKWTDYESEADVVPLLGDEHRIHFRVQGGMRSYAFGLTADGRAALFKNEGRYRKLADAPFAWSHGEVYKLKAEAAENRLRLFGNGSLLLDYRDEETPYWNGMIGFGNAEGSHTHFKRFSVRGTRQG